MASILFVHGTGVRKPSYTETLAVIEDALGQHGIACALETCLWGDDLGSKMPSASLPEAMPPDKATSFTEAQEFARWDLLYRDPTFELRLLKNRPRKAGPIVPGSSHAGTALWNRIQAYEPKESVNSFLKRWCLLPHWAEAWANIVKKPLDKPLVEEVLEASPDEIGELAQSIARAIVAQLTLFRIEKGFPLIDARQRDELIRLLIEAWGAQAAGISIFLRQFFGEMAASALTPIIKWKRAELSGAASPGAGDVLLYQTRGQGIRDYIEKRIKEINGDLILLAHSLGGIACVDLLIQKGEDLGHVKGLITVGSQAPLLYEIGALCSLEPDDELPVHFPHWINFYDPYDFLSYLASPVFKNDKVSDKRIESGQPFPQSHSAYWANSETWRQISEFLGKVC